MNPNITNEEWLEAWRKFLSTTFNLVVRKLELTKDPRRRQRLQALMPMFDFVLSRIHEISPDQIYRRLDLITEHEGRDEIAVLAAEMEYVNTQYAADQIASESEADAGIEAADVTKKSLEKLFKKRFLKSIVAIFPDWLLELLNELLKLARGVA